MYVQYVLENTSRIESGLVLKHSVNIGANVFQFILYNRKCEKLKCSGDYKLADFLSMGILNPTDRYAYA